MLPEVVLLAKTEDPLCRNALLLVPDLKRFFVILINRRIQTLRIQSHYLSQKLPGPCNGFFLKIISKREISQHLKEGTVTCGFTDVLDIAGTDTLLTGGDSASWRNLLSCKIWLQRRHTGIDDQQAVVIMRYQRKTLHCQMILALKKLQEHLS